MDMLKALMDTMARNHRAMADLMDEMRKDMGDERIVNGETTRGELNMNEIKLIHVKSAMERHSGERKSVAKELGISERTLYRYIKKWGLKQKKK